MILYRICNPQFRDDLSGTGAKLFGGRWNSKGVAMLYCSQHISLAVLEMLVHNQFSDFSIKLSLLQLSCPESMDVKEIKLQKLKNKWMDDHSYTQFMGDEFVKANNSAILKIPSAVITQEHNYIFNPLHPDFKKVKITQSTLFETDKRLFSI